LCATWLASSSCVSKFSHDFHCAFGVSLDYTTSNRLDNAGSGARGGRTSEPALKPARSEQGLFSGQCLGWLLEGPRGFGAAQKVHVHAPDHVMSELDIAGARSRVRSG